jgi:hypothetical protein
MVGHRAFWILLGVITLIGALMAFSAHRCSSTAKRPERCWSPTTRSMSRSLRCVKRARWCRDRVVGSTTR